MKASIIITNYQGIEFLPKCLSHLANQTYADYEIIFIDAGSTDGSADYVQKNYPNIKTIRCERIGIGEAINIGIKNSTGEIIVFDVNTDEYVEPNWLEELIEHLRRHDFNIISGTTRIIYNTNLIDEAGADITLFGRARKIGHGKTIEKFKFNSKQVDFVGCPAFHRQIISKIGYVDETYFIYGEDRDFCYRAKLKGIKTYCSSRALSYHHIRGTTGKNIRKLEYFLRRAIIRFEIIYANPVKLALSIFYQGVFLPLTSLIVLISHLRSTNKYCEKFIGRIEAVIWNLKNIKMTWKYRKKRKFIAKGIKLE